MDGKNTQKRKRRLNNSIWFFLNFFFTTVYIIWRLLFTIPTEYGIVSLVAGISLFAVEFFGMLEALVHYFNMHNILEYPLPDVPRERYPDVDVFIATYNEDCAILRKTINGCKHMEYPDPSKVHIYLCDDGRRPQVRALAKQMQVGYLDREDHKFAKAGNLNNALSKTKSPLIVTFDADMIPRRIFLMRTIPYFVQMEMDNEGKEEKDRTYLGFVQTPQVFYNPDLFQFNLFSEGRIPNEQDYFYRDIQVSRNKTNSVIYGGSNTVLSRRALKDVGGFFTGSITEDYGTGILLQKKGYLCIAVNEPLASGLSPDDLKSLIVQRRRWARGVIKTNRKLHIWLGPGFKLKQKINYWASCWYWYAPVKRLIYIMSPILFAVYGYMVIDCTLWEILIFWLPMYMTSNISLRLLSQNIRTTKWTSVYETVLFPYMLIPVLMETFGITMDKFKVTKKGQFENERRKNFVYVIPFVLLAALSVVGILNCLRLILASGDIGPVVVLFWLISNIFTLCMSIFFILGRDFVRKSERTAARESCELTIRAGTVQAVTSDISETGIAVTLDQPWDILEHEEISIRVWNQWYESRIKAKLVHVDRRGEQWKYAFRITAQGDRFDDYLQIIYDRVPTLPQNLDATSGVFEDLKINITRRLAQPFYEKRKAPRVDIGTDLPDINGRRWLVRDFNYRHITLDTSVAPGTLVLVVDQASQLKLECKYERSLQQSRQLYMVENYQSLHDDPDALKRLQDWVFVQSGKAMTMKEAGEGLEKAQGKQVEFDEMELL